MLADYHTHHYRCGHASGTLDEYVEAALAAGLTEIGLSDHSPIFHFEGDPHPFPKTAMHRDELDAYVRDMERVRDRYAGRIHVRLGIESDYILGWDEFYRSLWNRYSLDYVIGSVHWLGTWSVFRSELPVGKSREDVYEEYFRTVQAAAKSGVYDIIGHLDVPKTNGHMSSDVTLLVRETLRVIKEADAAIELNTSGWRKPVGECYPGPDILREAVELDIPITLGSDAHSPDLVGAGFQRALALLRECGCKHIAFFAERKRRLVPIDEVAAAPSTGDGRTRGEDSAG